MPALRQYLVLLMGLALGLSPWAQPGYAQTVHAILVADTNDPVLAAVCKRDIDIMHRRFVQVAESINFQLSEQIVAGDSFRSQQLDAVLRRLTPGPDDIIFLYYTGHGYNARARAGRFPVLWLDKPVAASGQNPGLMAIHTTLRAKGARLCITLGDCCNKAVSNMRGMVKKTSSPTALPVATDSVKAAYRQLFLNVTGDALIASSQPPEQSCAHPDSGSFYTRSFDEALDLASRYNKTISWETLLRDTQTRMVRHEATRFKQSIYDVAVAPVQATGRTRVTPERTDRPRPALTPAIDSALSFDLVNRQLNELTDTTLSDQQRRAAMHRLAAFFSKQARIDIYVNSTLGEVQPIETFVRRLYVNARHIQQINFIERLSEVAADGKQYKRAAIQEVW
jgi:hypothetical protein